MYAHYVIFLQDDLVLGVQAGRSEILIFFFSGSPFKQTNNGNTLEHPVYRRNVSRCVQYFLERRVERERACRRFVSIGGRDGGGHRMTESTISTDHFWPWFDDSFFPSTMRQILYRCSI